GSATTATAEAQQQQQLRRKASGGSATSSSSSSGGGSGGPMGRSVTRPLLAPQVEMKDREQIHESLLTGVKALDILTPLGRGSSLLLVGPPGSGKTRVALDAIAGQAAWWGAAAAAAGGSTAGAVSSSSSSAAAGTAAAGPQSPPPPPSGAVRCVLALVGRPREEVQSIISQLRSSGALPSTAVVAAPEGSPLGHQLAATCCACAIGERIRDEGGHALVVVDDLRPLSDTWERLLGGLAALGPARLREGLVKDERGRDVNAGASAGPAPTSGSTRPPTLSPSPPPPASSSTPPSASPPQPSSSSASSETPSSPASAPASSSPASSSPPASSSSVPSSSQAAPSPSAAPADAAGAAAVPASSASAASASSSSGSSGDDGGDDGGDEGALVEWEGMLVSGAVAQRRGFLSTFFLRAAKLSRTSGGGSLTLLPLVPGCCATGTSRRINLSKYKTLSPEQIAKLEAALRARQLADELASAGGAGGELATEVVEEFISIADGQLVLREPQGRGGSRGGGSESGSGSCSEGSGGAVFSPASSPSSSLSPAYQPDPRLSLTRIGSRAYCPALGQLAPQVRLQLIQAEDARRFAAAATARSTDSSSTTTSTTDQRADAAAQRLAAALLQEPGRPVGLSEQVVTLFAVQRGYLDAVPPDQVAAWLQGAMRHLAGSAAGTMQELGRTGVLSADLEAQLAAELGAFGSSWRAGW
ncbi:hypothetical protein Agub_g2446, partial [Astrephomene gubernaculifera]